MRRVGLLASSLLACGCSGAGREAPAEAPRGTAGESVSTVTNCPQPAVPASTAVNVEMDVPYAGGSDGDGDTLQFDIAWPKEGGPHPLVVLLHGGGWEGGSKAAMHDEMLALAGQGYAAASVAYRLTREGRNVFPAPVQDVRCAVRSLRARASTYGIDAGRVAAVGYSAGAHLASMLGVSADAEGLDRTCEAAAYPATVSAVVSHAGPQDLRVRGPYTREQARLVTNFLGVFPGDAPAIAAAASPLAYVSAGDAPFLFVHGTRDELVPVDHSRWMATTLRQAGVPATVVEVRGMGHGYVSLAAGGRPRVGCTVLAFLDRWVKNRSSGP